MQADESDLVDYSQFCVRDNINYKVFSPSNFTFFLKDTFIPAYLPNFCIKHICSMQVFEKEDLPDILGDIHVNLAFNPEQWSKILEQLLLVVLILGRWLLPKGKMSRDQFSQLMLGREIPFFRYNKL